MNRFRQLKDKLIKSKRDSQKLEQLPCTQKELEDWVEQQLEYYGISKESYRLKELKNVYEIINSDKRVLKNTNRHQNPESQRSEDNNNSSEMSNKLQKAFLKKTSASERSQSESSHSRYNELSFCQQSLSVKQSSLRDIQTKQQSKQNINENNCLASSKRLICKKPRNQHVSSMNDAQGILEKANRSESEEMDNFRSYHQVQDNQRSQLGQNSNKAKELDYYTLILQLTAQLNYSRLNKETSNEKSILNQIKNLISFIEGKSATETGFGSSNQTHSHNKNIQAMHSDSHSHNTNKKSNHTFSSVFSNQSIGNQNDHHRNEENCLVSTSEKRRIRYKLVGAQLQRDKEEQENSQKYDEENGDSQQGNKTFQSIHAFEEDQGEEEESKKSPNKTSIIDMVDNDFQSRGDGGIFIQDQEQDSEQHYHQNSLIENSPLSRITERQSEYTQSVSQSIQVSPSKYTPDKMTKTTSKLTKQNKFMPHLMEKHIESLYAENIFKKSEVELQSAQKQFTPNGTTNNWTKFLPENQIILKKLSDKLQNTYESHQLFDQSLEYKRILYMLDSEYGSSNSDYKNRTFSSLFGQKTSTPNRCASDHDKEHCQYSIKGASEESSAKSFTKEIFESNEEACQRQNHKASQKSPCLMRKLDSMFQTEYKMEQTPSPRLFNFSSQNELPSHSNSQNRDSNNLQKLVHKRSQTFEDCPSNHGMNKTIKYRFNLLSDLSHQINEESSENAFDNDKYEPIKTEYEEDSVFHKISRNSYLTSSEAQQQSHHGQLTSYESDLMDGNSHQNEKGKSSSKRGNLIVKKSKRTQKQQESMRSYQESPKEEASSMRLIVKKNRNNDSKLSNQSNQQSSRFHIMRQQNFNQSSIYQNDMSVKEIASVSFSGQQISSRTDNKAHSAMDHNSNHSHNKSLSPYSSSQQSPSTQSPPSSKQNPLQSNHPNRAIKSPSLNESKVSISSNRQIKYKVYASPTQHKELKGGSQKQDKRKVLKDIVSVLNTKYNRNIKLKQ